MKFNLKTVFIIAIVFKVLFLLVTLAIFYKTPSVNGYSISTNPIITSFYQWDGSNYLAICKNGYLYEDDYPSSIRYFAFLPGMSILNCTSIQLVDFITDSETALLGPVAVNFLLLIALVVAIKYYLDLYYPKFDKGLKIYILITFLIFPFSFFINLNYTESIYLPLTFLALILLKRQDFKNLGWVGFILSLVRVNSIPLGFMLAVNYLNSSLIKVENLFNKAILVDKFKKLLYFIPFGFGIVVTLLFYQIKYNSASLFFTSQRDYYGRVSSFKFYENVYQYLNGKATYWDTFDWSYLISETKFYFYDSTFRYLHLLIIPFLFVAMASIFLIIKKRWWELSFSWVMWLVPMLSEVNSLNRYLILSFPFIFVVSEFAYKNIFTKYLLVIVYIILFVLYLNLHSHGFWIGLLEDKNIALINLHNKYIYA